MAAAKVLLIERPRTSGHIFSPALERRGYDLITAETGRRAIELAEDSPPDVIILNAPSLRTSGNRICRDLKARLENVPVIHIKLSSDNSTSSDADVVLFLPFTSRKLINRIERFIGVREGRKLTCGPFTLDLYQRTLIFGGQEKRLTPKLTALMAVFMRNPGQTLPRSYLMQKVWETSYLEDTRTLDVHIHWLRKVIEKETAAPHYLITVRGVGYRFEPEPPGGVEPMDSEREDPDEEQEPAEPQERQN